MDPSDRSDPASIEVASTNSPDIRSADLWEVEFPEGKTAEAILPTRKQALQVISILLVVPALVLLLTAAALGLAVFGAASSMGYVAIQLLFPITAILWVFLKSFWVRIPPPEGFALDLKQHPGFARMIEEIFCQAKAPKIDRVLIDGRFNAMVAKVGSRRYLVLGAPLLHALSANEARAVIAHEVGHLSREHGRLGPWIYRTYEALVAVYKHAAANSPEGHSPLTGLLDRYLPMLDRVTLPFRRAQEWEADRISVACVGSRATALALTRSDIAEGIYSDLLRQQYEAALLISETMPDISPQIACSLDEVISNDDGRERLKKALSAVTNDGDSHPALRDRLRAIGMPAVLRKNPEPSAWNVLFEDQAQQLSRRFHVEYWEPLHGEAWQRQHNQVLEKHRSLIQAKAADRSKWGEEEWMEFASVREELEGAESGISAWREVVERIPHLPVAQWRLGLALYNSRKEAPNGVTFGERRTEGLKWMDTAFSNDPSIYIPTLPDELAEAGDPDGADLLRRYGPAFEKIQAEASAERMDFKPGDEVEPHNLPPDVLAESLRLLSLIRGAKRIRIARKRMRHYHGSGDIAWYVEMAWFYKGEASPAIWRTKEFALLSEDLGPFAPQFILIDRPWRRDRKQLRDLYEKFCALMPEALIAPPPPKRVRVYEGVLNALAVLGLVVVAGGMGYVFYRWLAH